MPRRCSRSPTSCLSATSSSSGELRSSDGTRVDLRNIKSPIIVFCSWGDDITPPQQALDWILDLYDHEDEIVAAGQTIVYCLHQSIGHLGIFVSGKVATKEHGNSPNAMDMIDLMPPGLYEAVITGVDETVENPELVQGNYLFTSRDAARSTTSVSSAATAPRTTSPSRRPPGFRRSTRGSTAR